MPAEPLPTAPLICRTARTPPGPRRRGRRLVLAGVALVCGLVGSGPWTGTAGAEVRHGVGFAATVAGWRSWYGSYLIEGVGESWCVDHGLVAPDADHGYVAGPLPERAPATQRAMAWAVGRHGRGRDPVVAAALMLALHDLAGATYPTGVLSVDRLGPGDLTGFGGREGEVLRRAREIRADSVAHSGFVAPWRLAITAPPARPGDPSDLRATLVDGDGRPVPGATLLVDGVGFVTGPDGAVQVRKWAVPGPNRFVVRVSLPDLRLRAFRPTRRPAQRVVRAALVTVEAEAGFVSETPTHTLTLLKTGDAEPWLPVAGARFEVAPAGSEDGPPAAVLVAGGAMTATLPAGQYQVIETAPPAGYRAAGPWVIDLRAGDATLRAENRAIPGRLVVAKVDAAGQPLAGARLRLVHDADRDGRYETEVAAWTSGAEPVRHGDLRPGSYQVIEDTAPPGYVAAPDPLPVMVPAGAEATVTVRNEAIPPPPTTTTTTSTTAPPPPSTTTTTAPPPPSTTTAPPVRVAAAPPRPRPTPTPTLPVTGPPPGGHLPAEAAAGTALISLGCLLLAASRLRPTP